MDPLVSDIYKPARIGERKAHVPLPTFEKGAQVAMSVLDISEWIKSEKGGGGARAPAFVWEGGGGAQVTRPVSDIFELITCQRGSAELGRWNVSLQTTCIAKGHRWSGLRQTSVNWLKARKGEARVPPNLWEGGAQKARPVSDISEWIKIYIHVSKFRYKTVIDYLKLHLKIY